MVFIDGTIVAASIIRGVIEIILKTNCYFLVLYPTDGAVATVLIVMIPAILFFLHAVEQDEMKRVKFHSGQIS